MATANNHSTTFVVPTTVTTEQIGPYTLRYGPRQRVGGWFIRDAKSGAYLPLPSFAAVRHYLSELRKKYPPTDPTPTTPAARPVLMQATVHAVSAPAVENTIRFDDHTCTRCGETAEWLMCNPCAEAVAWEQQPDNVHLRSQAFMCAKTGQQDYRIAHRMLMNGWIAQHPIDEAA